MKALKTILLFYIISRLLIFLALSIGQSDTVQYADNQLKLESPVLDHFVLYDSYNYAQIAVEGYSEDRLTAFFPLFPLIVRGFAAVSGMGVYWTGFVLSNLFFVCSLWLLYSLMIKKGLSERIRNLALLLLCFFPSSYFFSAFYTESFFLFLALLAFRLWENEKRWAAYFVGGLAAITRIVGVWIPLAFFMERLIRRKLDFQDLIYAFMSALMFFIYPIYLWLTKGSPLLFLKVQAPDFGRYSTIPFFPIYQDIVSLIERFHSPRLTDPIIVFHLVLFLIFIGYLISSMPLLQRGTTIPWSEVIYTFGLILMPLSSALDRNVNVSTHGFMRYILTVFPLFIFLANVLNQVMIRADKNSRHTYVAAWKSFNYIILFIWVSMSIYILFILRIKGFVA